MMELYFDKSKGVQNGQVKNYVPEEERGVNGKHFKPIDIMRPTDNHIQIEGTDYYFKNLEGAKGGNSVMLELYEAQNFNLGNIEYVEPDLILKMLKYESGKAKRRFAREIEALLECESKGFQNVISISHSGTCKIFKNHKSRFEDYPFYTMNYAEYDLESFILENSNSSLFDKITLCLSLAEGLKELYSLGYYHRDIKPDNIFIVNGEWKIADLGLVDHRDQDFALDKKNDFIGPKGWLSPEAMNKFLCEDKGFPFDHDCEIDHQSDIFQLGRVYCYILQFNNPVGVFRQKDFIIKNNRIYQVLRTMLNYSKKRRYKDIDEIIYLLKLIQNQLMKVN